MRTQPEKLVTCCCIALCFTTVVAICSSGFAMEVTVKGKTYSVSQLGQQAAVRIMTVENNKKEVSIAAGIFSAHPFHAGKTIMGLALGEIDQDYKDFRLVGKWKITIEDADGFFLIPTRSSALPLWFDASKNYETVPLVRAANVTWEFQKEGIRFETVRYKYESKKAGATISFTPDGVLIDGVERKERPRRSDEKSGDAGAPVQETKSAEAVPKSNEQESSPKDEGVALTYDPLVGSSTVSVSMQDPKTGEFVKPGMPVVFGPNIANKHKVIAKAKGKTIECPLLSQGYAYLLDKKGDRGKKLEILYYKGCPFALEGDLEVVKDLEFSEESKISIDSATDNILWVSQNSSLPFVPLRGRLVASCQQMVNVKWVFADKGTTFRAGKTAYLVEKPGATIHFTKNGVVLDGVRKAESKPDRK